ALGRNSCIGSSRRLETCTDPRVCFGSYTPALTESYLSHERLEGSFENVGGILSPQWGSECRAVWISKELGTTFPLAVKNLRQRPVRPQRLVCDGLHQDEPSGQQVLRFQLVRILGKEPLALARAPDAGQLFF